MESWVKSQVKKLFTFTGGNHSETSEQAFQDNLSTFSALNNLEYGEAQEFFLPSDPEQKIRERAESVVRPGTYMYRKGTSLGSPLGLNTYIHTHIQTYFDERIDNKKWAENCWVLSWRLT